MMTKYIVGYRYLLILEKNVSLMGVINANRAFRQLELIRGEKKPSRLIHSFIHSFILETYIAPFQETRPTTQRRSQPSHGQKKDFREM